MVNLGKYCIIFRLILKPHHMAKKAKILSEKKVLQKEVAVQLENSLGKLKQLLGEKRLGSRINKAVKLFTKGIKKKDKKPREETIKKATPVNKNASIKNSIPTPKNEKRPVKGATTKRPPLKKSATAKNQSKAKQG